MLRRRHDIRVWSALFWSNHRSFRGLQVKLSSARRIFSNSQIFSWWLAILYNCYRYSIMVLYETFRTVIFQPPTNVQFFGFGLLGLPSQGPREGRSESPSQRGNSLSGAWSLEFKIQMILARVGWTRWGGYCPCSLDLSQDARRVFQRSSLPAFSAATVLDYHFSFPSPFFSFRLFPSFLLPPTRLSTLLIPPLSSLTLHVNLPHHSVLSSWAGFKGSCLLPTPIPSQLPAA